MLKVALVSKHQKANIVAPLLTPLGIQVLENDTFDTDTLGTFSGEIERTLSPKDCALAKAKKACELGDVDAGLGSEGSFGGGPMPGFINWNTEILCFYQRQSDTAIYAMAEGASKVDNITVSSLDKLEAKLAQHPDQRWIFRDENEIKKGLSAKAAIALFATFSSKTPFKLEPDLRAMHCPERRQMIAQAAENLAQRLTSFCPECGHVDFVIKAIDKGLPCELCRLPTNSVKAHILRCDKCGCQKSLPVESSYANPANCPFCNP